ncbi:MAG: ParB/RepB/Spo0J family partition protein [Paracoccaceae bacterium]
MKRGLGRGLTALMADVAPAETLASATTDRLLPIENIHPNPDQPRVRFAQDNLDELAESIKQKGILQPLIVRKNTNKTNSYEIIAGERRWRAAQLAKLHEVPVLVRDYSDDEVLEVAIIENVQRADLNPVEEAAGYRQLMDRFGHTQEKVASALSKSRSHIANLLRLLHLPDDVLELLRSEKITAGHARALITTENPSLLARRVVSQGLTVRETEKLAKSLGVGPKRKPGKKKSKDADTLALENDLSANLKMKVQIEHKNSTGAGQMVIRYKDMEQLDDLCAILSRSN